MALVDNCIAYYKFDGDVTDETGNYDLTNSGTSDTTGKINNARLFVESSTQYVYRNSLTDLNVGTSNYTYNCWIYVVDASDYAAYHTLFNKGGTDVASGMECITDQSGSNGRINLLSKEHGWIRMPSTYDWTAGSWQMFTLTWDGSTPKLYRNGTIITGGTTNAGDWNNTTHNFEIGKNYQGTSNARKYWDGKIDEFGIWTRALSQAEITELYNSGNGLSYPFTTGWSNIFNGVSSIAKINGVEVANIAKVNGV